MTIGLALVIIAVLYLLDKHGLLKKTLKVAGFVLAIGACIAGIGVAISYGLDFWKDHRFAETHECFNVSTGKVHDVNDSEPWCTEVGFDQRERGTRGDIFDQLAAKQNRPASPLPPGFTSARQPLPPGLFPLQVVPQSTAPPAIFDVSKSKRIICYNEETRISTDVQIENGHSACKPPLIYMEQVTQR